MSFESDKGSNYGYAFAIHTKYMLPLRKYVPASFGLAQRVSGVLSRVYVTLRKNATHTHTRAKYSYNGENAFGYFFLIFRAE